MSRRSGDEGAAALEMALVTTVLLAVVGFVAPLGVIYYESVQLGRTASDVVRFASARPTLDRTVVDPATGAVSTVPAGTLPTVDQITYEAARTTGTRNKLVVTVARPRPAVGVPSDPGFDKTCPSGRRVTVTLQNDVDLGAFTGLIPFTNKPLSATASSCEE